MKLAIAAAAAAAGCLGPQVADTPAPSGDIVAAGTPVPSIDEEAGDAATLAANDGVSGTVPRWSAFAAGAPTHVWDFGTAPAFAAPIFELAQRQTDGSLVFLPHPPIVGTIPGEAGYSPYWQVFALVVTDRYSGELITAATAIEEAVRDGLVEAPVAQPFAVDYPMVASDVRLDVGTATPLAPATVMFYEHHTVTYFDFGQLAVTNDVHVPIAPRYVLHRDGEEPLSEPIRGVDMDGDGDIIDSNDVYERAAGDAMRSPLCQTIDVAVVKSVSSIDTTQNDAMAQIEDATQMFAPQPVAGLVVAYSVTNELRNCPVQRTAGGL